MTDERTRLTHVITGEILALNDESPLFQYEDVNERINRLNGWYDEEKSMDADVALLHSEISEVYEEHRNGHAPTEVYFTHDKKCRFQAGEVETVLTTDQVTCCVLKPEGIPTEIADEFIRLLDFCRRRGIDLAFETRRKLQYNITRGYKHGGKVV